MNGERSATMPASSTDVRAWAREQGHDLPSSRGPLPKHIKAAYDEAHPAPVVPGVVEESSFDPSMGVTEAVLPPDDDYPDPGGAAEPAAKTKGELNPRAVKLPPAKGACRTRLFGPAKPTAH